MSQFSIRTRSPYPSPTGSVPEHTDVTPRKSFKFSLAVLAVICGLIFAVNHVIADTDQVLLDQSLTLSASGYASNLYIPQQATVFFDYTIQPGKNVLLVVITEEQWQAVSAGEKASGLPLLRTTVSGSGTESVSLPKGTYTVALIPQDGAAQATIKARCRY
ncbi:MAG: hypothetical protein WB290_03735 [Smithella sp.]